MRNGKAGGAGGNPLTPAPVFFYTRPLGRFTRPKNPAWVRYLDRAARVPARVSLRIIFRVKMTNGAVPVAPRTRSCEYSCRELSDLRVATQRVPARW